MHRVEVIQQLPMLPAERVIGEPCGRDTAACIGLGAALIARQETELKRLSAEIQHELDLMQRGDAGLREQMAKFQRRAQEVMTKPPPSGRR